MARRLAIVLIVAGGILAAVTTFRAIGHVRQNGVSANIFQQQRFRTPRRIRALVGERPLHAIRVRTAPGVVAVSWYDSDFEPTQSSKRYFVTLYVDGVAQAAVAKDGKAGKYEDGGVLVRWDVSVAAGVHRFVVAVEPKSALGPGLPYTDPGHVGLDSMSVEQIKG